MNKKTLSTVLVIVLTFAFATMLLPAYTWNYPDDSEDDRYEKFGPRADRILILLYADDEAEFTAFEAKDLDIVDWPLSEARITKWTAPAYDYIKMIDYGTEYGYFVIDINNNPNEFLGNPPDPAYSNPVYPNPTGVPGMRHAIAHLLDRTYACDQFWGGYAVPMYTDIAPVQLGVHPEIRPSGALENLTHPYSRAEAASILDASGFILDDGTGYRYWDINDNSEYDGGDEYLELDFHIRSDHPQRNLLGEWLAAELEAVNVRCPGNYGDSYAHWLDVMLAKDFHLYTGGWSVGVDPDTGDLYWIDYYWHPGFAYNYGAVNCSDFNYWHEKVVYANTFGEAMEAVMKEQEAFCDPSCCGALPVCSTGPSIKAVQRRYVGPEAPYTDKQWKGIVTRPGYGPDDWYTFLNMYPEGHPMGDGENMTIRYGFKVRELKKLNPVYAEWLWDWNTLGLIYDSLLARDPYTQEWQSQLVKSFTEITWVDPEDGQTKSGVRFTLRNDIYWHDGTPFSAADVFYTLWEFPRALIAAGYPPPWWWASVRYIKSIYQIDACNIEILLSIKSVWAIGWIGGGIILPKHIWMPILERNIAGTNPDYEEIEHYAPDPNLIGTGPWRLAEYNPGASILMLNNKPSTTITTNLDGATAVHSPYGFYDRCPVHANVHTLKEYEWVSGEIPPYVSSQWHQVKGPDISTEWHLDVWEDTNDNGILDQCDYITLSKKPELTETVREHVYYFNYTTHQLWTDWYSQKVPPRQGNAFGVTLHNQWCNPIPNTAYNETTGEGACTGSLIVNKYVWLVYPNGTEKELVYDETVELPYCKHHKEIFNLVLDPCNHTLKVAVHVKGPEMIKVTKEGGIEWVKNPWICCWSNYTFPFWVTIKEDVAGTFFDTWHEGYEEVPAPDCYVDITDILLTALAFGSYPGHEDWMSVCDISGDYYVDISDILMIALKFGPP